MLFLYPQSQSLDHEGMLPTLAMVRRRPSLHVWDVLPAPTLCFITFIQKKKKYDHYCPVHVSNYLQYVARPSHSIAKVGSVKVSGILEA